MQPKKLIILLVVAVAVCIAAIVTYNQQQTKPYSSASKNVGSALGVGKPVFPDLESKMPSIARVEVETKGKKVVVARADGAADWKVESAGGYPASSGGINELVLNLIGMKVGERETDNPAKYANFGLTSGTIAGHVLLADAKGASLAELTWGREGKVEETDSEQPMRPRSGGRYLLRGGDAWVYLANDDLPACKTETVAWVDPLVISVPRDKVVGVHIDHGTTETLTLDWQDNKLQLKETLPGMTVKQSDVDSLAQALDGVRLSDVMAASDAKAQALEFGTPCDIQSKDGTIYHVKTAQVGEKGSAKKWYMQIATTYGSPVTTAADEATTVTQAAAEKGAKDAEAAVPAFNEKHSPWVYELAEWGASKFAKKRSDLLQAEVKKDETKTGEAAGPGAPGMMNMMAPGAAGMSQMPGLPPGVQMKPSAAPAPAKKPAASEKKPAASEKKPADAPAAKKDTKTD
jgi:hypothetical protein